MKFQTLKTLALTSAVALLAYATTGPASAQDNQAITATFETSSAITTAKTSDMNFGEWFVDFVTGTPTLTLTDDGTNDVTQTGTIGTSQVIEIDDTNITEGGLTVSVPASGTALTMTASGFTDIVDGGLSLDVVSYNTATESGSVITGGVVVGAGVTVTAVTGGTPEAVALGGEIDITATPTDAAHTADFTLTFTY